MTLQGSGEGEATSAQKRQDPLNRTLQAGSGSQCSSTGQSSGGSSQGHTDIPCLHDHHWIPKTQKYKVRSHKLIVLGGNKQGVLEGGTGRITAGRRSDTKKVQFWESRHMQERSRSVAGCFAFIWSPQWTKLFWNWGQSGSQGQQTR